MNQQTRNINFRIFLQDEYLKRTQKNTKYSLRAFAKSLEIEASLLSKILRSRISLTDKMILRLGERLKLPQNEIQIFLNKQNKKNKTLFKNYNEVDDQLITQISEDEFSLISDWHHLALLELISLKDFEPNADWISNKLQLPVIQIELAIHRLIRLGHLKITSDGRWIDCYGNSSTLSIPIKNVALKKMQLQILDLAKNAIENVEPDRRDQSTMTFSCDISLLPEIKEKIKIFRRSLAEHLQRKSKTKNQVYQMSVSLFPVTNNIQNEVQQ